LRQQHLDRCVDRQPQAEVRAEQPGHPAAANPHHRLSEGFTHR
jgi:hypothetical protein